MTSFCRAANLRALIMDPDSPGLMGVIRMAFDRTFGSSLRGTLGMDLWTLDPAGMKSSVPTWAPNVPTQTLSRASYKSLKKSVLEDHPGATISKDV